MPRFLLDEASAAHPAAPPWQVSEWLNSPVPLALDALRGRVVVLHAFQMLCPACVSHGIPQAKKLHQIFPDDAVAVVGLHTVFEHHEAMGPAALRAFVHEYRVGFPVGIDAADPGGPAIPRTMRAYGFEGTPSLALIDRAGRLRLQHFGALDDMVVGAAVAQLVAEAA